MNIPLEYYLCSQKNQHVLLTARRRCAICRTVKDCTPTECRLGIIHLYYYADIAPLEQITVFINGKFFVNQLFNMSDMNG